MVWCPLLGGICPGVAIVEVEHQEKSGILDALAELLDEFKILADVFVGIFRGIYEESYANRVPTLFFNESQHVGDSLAILVEEGGFLGFVFR